jgi:adenylate cyclase
LEENYIKKLISPEVFALLEKSPETLAPKYQAVAVGFADVRDFTRLSNRLETFQVSNVLQLFFKHAALLVRQGGGFLDKFIGDSVMWFHQAGSIKASCAECLETAAKIISNMDALNEVIQRRLHLKLRIEIGMGMACGNAAVGIFGAPEIRIHYGVLGPPVNLAARLCSEAPAGTLLIGGEAIEHCAYETTPVAFQAIKGFDHEVEVRKVQVPKLALDQEWHFLLNV